MTETTQPDPQVVACPTCAAVPRERCTLEDGRTPSLDHMSRYNLAERAARRAARTPLTVADIPAGQGPASLYVGRPEAFRRTGLGEFALLFKRTDGSSEVVDWPPEGQSPGSAALWDHLAATLPHVTD